MTAPLSPAAQAVLDATLGEGCVSWRDRRRIAAAALRAAADQVAVADPLGDTLEDCVRGTEREHMRGKFHALANELEAL